MRPLGRLLVVSWLVLLAPLGATGGEEATAKPRLGEAEVSYSITADDLVLRQIRVRSLSHLGYVLGSRGEALVVDPLRDVEPYLAQAEALGLEIRHVLLTHTHADFVAGHTELRARTGATVLAPAASEAAFDHRPLADGDTLAVGALTLQVLATPGHTSDAMTVLVRAGEASTAPVLAFTGDMLLVGDVGCPEPAGADETPMALAESAFDSMQRLALLPSETKLLPTHGGGPFCGTRLEPYTVSTVGRERQTNPYVKTESRAAFAGRLLDRLPPTPPYHEHVARLNRRGPPRVDAPCPLAPVEASGPGTWVVDVRPPRAYAQGHVRGSVNVPVAGPLEPWTGAVVPFDARLVLVGDDDESAEAARRLLRVRAGPVAGRLAGDVAAWRAAGLAVATSEILEPEDLARRRAAGIEPLLVDVRSGPEVARARIEGSVHVPLYRAERFSHLFQRDRPLVLICKTGYRSTIAVGLAERQGFERLADLIGGVDAWIGRGLPVVGAGADSGNADRSNASLDR